MRNRIRCKKCGSVIESVSTHDWKECKCGSVFVDGGQSYARWGWPSGNMDDWIEDLSAEE